MTSSGLLLDIARCPVVAERLVNPSHPCAQVVHQQSVTNVQNLQVPEPWTGHIEKAPIPFLSSNPGLDASGPEDCPVSTWSDGGIIDFFHNRFDGGQKPWIINGHRALLKSGQHRRWTPFWASIRHRAGELLGESPWAVVPGEDFASTEVVHGKSPVESLIGDAKDFCVERYLKRVLNAAEARAIVCLGDIARDAILARCGLSIGQALSGPIAIEGRRRFVVVLPHPNRKGPPKSIRAWPGPVEVERIRAFLPS